MSRCGRESGVVREKSAITTPGSVRKYRHQSVNKCEYNTQFNKSIPCKYIKMCVLKHTLGIKYMPAYDTFICE